MGLAATREATGLVSRLPFAWDSGVGEVAAPLSGQNTGVSEGPLSYLSRQREISWRLLELHLRGLTDEEALWKPAPIGLHVHRAHDHRWTADWPAREDYGVGPPSIAWLTWHVGFWWSMVLNHTFGDARLRREDVFWPGSVESTRAWLTECERGWGEATATLTARRSGGDNLDALADGRPAIRRCRCVGERGTHEERGGDWLRSIPSRCLFLGGAASTTQHPTRRNGAISGPPAEAGPWDCGRRALTGESLSGTPHHAGRPQRSQGTGHADGMIPDVF